MTFSNELVDNHHWGLPLAFSIKLSYEQNGMWGQWVIGAIFHMFVAGFYLDTVRYIKKSCLGSDTN